MDVMLALQFMELWTYQSNWNGIQITADTKGVNIAEHCKLWRT
jgi:hypothetical protein